MEKNGKPRFPFPTLKKPTKAFFNDPIRTA
jgi:hypothetical protein